MPEPPTEGPDNEGPGYNGGPELGCTRLGCTGLPWSYDGARTLTAFRRWFSVGKPIEGSVSSKGQCSFLVRGRMVLECNGKCVPGELRDRDLRFFENLGLLTAPVRRKTLEWTKGVHGAYLYAFYFKDQEHDPVRHPVGWVLTTAGDTKYPYPKYVCHWTSRWDSRYNSTILWLADQLGRLREHAGPRPPEAVIADANEEFLKTASDEVLDELGRI